MRIWSWLLCLAAVSAGGCVDSRSFVISKAQALDQECNITGDTGISLRSGLLDLAGQQGYLLFPVLRNDLLTNAADGQGERNRLVLQRWEIELTLDDRFDLPSGISPNAFSFSFPIASTLMEPGEQLFTSVEVIRQELAVQLSVPAGERYLINAELRAIATHNGSERESSNFIFPIEVCTGCLVTELSECPTDPGDGTGPVQPTFTTNNPCGIPQETPLICCTDPVIGFVCLDN